MAALPLGTVTMLFSDIEGSTVLLSRLGAAYVDALDGQRRVLRSAWMAHKGIELGTEGDSFFVAFHTAQAAVAAAAQAQRALDAFGWPAGGRVRVRMGVHTGSPQVHDGGYVGMDVHRAARIAGAAHGGQVLVSEATEKLAEGCLPDGVGLRELGSYRLKDIAAPERLSQLVIDGLQADFPAVKSVGAASSLPTPTSPLVGRDGELVELTALLSSPEVRLVTLTGPGGSGKTRLAIGLAQRLVQSFPDGVYFVPLAAVTAEAVMWTSIGEVLDVPPEERIPPGFFAHVAHRSALFVLDNLEQLPGADRVVSQLLAAAPDVVVLTTSRRPLHLVGEHEHPVPPLELPDETSLSEAERSGAVQLFVQHARMVRPSFTLAVDNAADVVQICRALDGLPLAIELAAARTKLLSPRALLARLDHALELRDTAVDRPGRHQTLRDTIAWSHHLLTTTDQILFRRLGVFAGSADLDAVATVTGTLDPLPLATELVDASLVRVDDGPLGEARIRLLQTVRTFALDALVDAAELDQVRRLHASHYLALAETAANELRGPDFLAARQRIESELPNLREALDWSLEDVHDYEDRLPVGLRLCSALSWFWYTSGYVAEGRQWTQRATARASGEQGEEFARVLHSLGVLLMQQGYDQHGRDVLAKCLRTARRTGDLSMIAKELTSLGLAYRGLGDDARARELMEESLAIARETDDKQRLATVLSNLALLELDGQRPSRAIEFLMEAEAVDRELGDAWGIVVDQVNRVAALIEIGSAGQGLALLTSIANDALALTDTDVTASVIELCAVCLGTVGDAPRCAQLYGAAAALREQAELPLSQPDAAFYERHLEQPRRALGLAQWQARTTEGRHWTAAEALDRALR